MGNCIPGELCFVRLGLGVVCTGVCWQGPGLRCPLLTARRLVCILFCHNHRGFVRKRSWQAMVTSWRCEKRNIRYFWTFCTKWQTNSGDIFRVGPLHRATAPGHPPCVSQAAVVTSAWPWLGEGVAAAVLADSSAPRSAAGAGAHHHAARLGWGWRPGIAGQQVVLCLGPYLLYKVNWCHCTKLLASLLNLIPSILWTPWSGHLNDIPISNSGSSASCLKLTLSIKLCMNRYECKSASLD